jgi:hypothetical protein
VQAAGGVVRTLDWEAPTFNRRDPLLSGFIAVPPGLAGPVKAMLDARPAPAPRAKR